jgi:hypothetical protein
MRPLIKAAMHAVIPLRVDRRLPEIDIAVRIDDTIVLLALEAPVVTTIPGVLALTAQSPSGMCKTVRLVASMARCK